MSATRNFFTKWKNIVPSISQVIAFWNLVKKYNSIVHANFNCDSLKINFKFSSISYYSFWDARLKLVDVLGPKNKLLLWQILIYASGAKIYPIFKICWLYFSWLLGGWHIKSWIFPLLRPGPNLWLNTSLFLSINHCIATKIQVSISKTPGDWSWFLGNRD